MTYGIKLKDKIGYALGDIGMQCAFGLIASVLQKYYTDVLLIPIAWVMMLFVVPRIWDAVNDPMWGSIVDSRPVRGNSRYGRFMKYFCIPMAVSCVLMFVKIPGLSQRGYFIYACVTYILFGMTYTCVNVPYGSMAGVITTDDNERSGLSAFRSIGAALGTVPGLILIMLCYKTENGIRVMSYPKILTGVILISALAALCCYLCQRLSVERAINTEVKKDSRLSAGATFKAIACNLKSLPFLVLSVAAMLFLAASVFAQSYYTYLADKYFGMSSLSMLALVCQYVPVIGVMFFIDRWIRGFGRRKLCCVGMIIAAVMNFVLFILQTTNPWIFLLFCLLAGCGNALMFLQVWALATEVIDYNKEVYGVKEEAISYSLFSFIRKLGHAVSAIFVNASLLKIGYSVANVTEDTLHGMYNSSVLIPAILYLVVAALLFAAELLLGHRQTASAYREGNKG